jgi:hypothetical protein
MRLAHRGQDEVDDAEHEHSLLVDRHNSRDRIGLCDQLELDGLGVLVSGQSCLYSRRGAVSFVPQFSIFH